MRYPLFLDLSTRRVVVVGGGAVATRRARGAADAGADVVVVAPDVDAALDTDARVSVVRRPFAPADLDGAWLVHACTDDADVNAAVAAEAERRHVWCVRADDAASSAAWVPASTAVDEIQVAVSAGGDPGRARELRDAVARLLHGGDLNARPARRGGGVVLVGGGPGDPGLLTLRGYRALLEADVVVVDRLGPTGLVDVLPPHVDIVDVGKTPGGPAADQRDINALLVGRALAGDRVVRLKGGDPFVLGRGGEEVDACVAADVPVEVVPGVTSATAAAALAGVTLTRRGGAQSFTVVSGHVPPGDPRSTVDWSALAASGSTLVLLMAVSTVGAIAAALAAAGLAADTPAVVVANASLPEQVVVRSTLAAVAADVVSAGVEPPAVIVIGDAAGASAD